MVLAVAIILGVMGTLLRKFSDGFEKPTFNLEVLLEFVRQVPGYPLDIKMLEGASA